MKQQPVYDDQMVKGPTHMFSRWFKDTQSAVVELTSRTLFPRFHSERLMTGTLIVILVF